MKKIVTGAFLFLMSLPVTALAGTGYLPLYIVDSVSSVHTPIHISSIGVDQTVTLTFYKIDGTPLANQNVSIKNGTPTVVSAQTSPTGTVIQNMVANSTMQVTVTYGGGEEVAQGYAKIEGSKFGLIASALIRNLNPTPDVPISNVYQRSLLVNGGNPF